MQAETLIKFILVLVPLLLLWGFSYWFAHYRNSSQWLKNNLYLERLETLSLAPGSALHLVKLGEDKLVLLSVSAGRTDMIVSLDNKDLKPLLAKKNDLKSPDLMQTGEKT